MKTNRQVSCLNFLICAIFLFIGNVFAQMQIKNSNQSALITVMQNGNVGIGTTAPGALLHTVGTVRFGGTLGTGSTVDQLLMRNTSGDVRPMNWPPGLADGDNDNYVSAVSVGGSAAKTITLTRAGTGTTTPLTATWSDLGDGVVNAVAVSGSTTKTMTLARTTGLATLTATWTDYGGDGADGVVEGASFTSTADKIMTLTRSIGANVTATFADYHVTAAPVSGTSTKTMTISRNGLGNIVSTWLDYDTDNYVSSATVSGTTNKSLTLARTGGLASLTATWLDATGTLADGVVTAAGFSDAANKVMTLTRSIGVNVTGTFTDYHVTAAPVTGTSTKSMTISRNGLGNIVSTWLDYDTDNYVSSATVSGTTNKSLTLARTGGLSTLTATWTDGGSDGVVSGAAVSGTATKSLTLSRTNGLATLTATFTDIDYDTYVNGVTVTGTTTKTLTLSRASTQGFGALTATWSDAAGTNYWQRNGTTLAPATIADKVAIGTTAAPSGSLGIQNVGGYELTFEGTGSANIYNPGGAMDFLTGAGYQIQFRTNAATTPHMIIESGGEVGIGISAPAYKLDVSGTARISGAATLGSTLTVASTATLNSNLTVAGNITDTGSFGSGTGTVTIYAQNTGIEGGELVLSGTTSYPTSWIIDNNTSNLRMLSGTDERFKMTPAGVLTLSNLAGPGNRTVYADANGVLKTLNLVPGGMTFVTPVSSEAPMYYEAAKYDRYFRGNMGLRVRGGDNYRIYRMKISHKADNDVPGASSTNGQANIADVRFAASSSPGGTYTLLPVTSPGMPNAYCTWNYSGGSGNKGCVTTSEAYNINGTLTGAPAIGNEYVLAVQYRYYVSTCVNDGDTNLSGCMVQVQGYLYYEFLRELP